MKSYHVLAIALCGSLGACGGISSKYAAWYDPAAAQHAGPVDVAVVGPAGTTDDASVAATVTDALRARGMQAGTTTAAGVYDPGYRLTVLYGPVAARVAEAGNHDDDAGLCRMINSQSPAALQGASSATAPDGTPVLAVLCWRNSFQSLAYAKLDAPSASGSQVIQARMNTLLDQVFPAMNWEAYDNANRG